jgi:DNA polymerase III epsilon subunit-like protein
MWNKQIVLVDLETSGLNPNLQEIIEIGAIKLSQPDFKVLGWMNVKLTMDHPEFGSPEAFKVNGYTPDAWKGALSQQEGMRQFADFASGCVVMAYNVTFDWGFIDATMNRLAIKHDISYHRLDVLTLAWWVVPQLPSTTLKAPKYIRLKNVCEYLGVKPEPEVHRAALGALTAARVLRGLHCMGKEEHLKRSEAELNVLETEIMTPPTPVLEEVKEEIAQIGIQADWDAAHKAAEEVLSKDEIEFS